jgi:hypothetical protein
VVSGQAWQGGCDRVWATGSRGRRLGTRVPCCWASWGEISWPVGGRSGHRPRASEIGSWHRQRAMEGGSCCCDCCGCNKGGVCWGRGVGGAVLGHRSPALLVWPPWRACQWDRCSGFLLDSGRRDPGQKCGFEHSWQRNGVGRRWVSRLQRQVPTSTCSCWGVASSGPWSCAPIHSGRSGGRLAVSCCSFVSWGCCVSASVESARRSGRSVWCSQETGRHEVSRPCGCECVEFDALDGGRPCHTRGTCMGVGDLVGRRRAGPWRWASSERLPFLLIVVVRVSRPASSEQPPVLSPRSTADSVNCEVLWRSWRVACDRRRSDIGEASLYFFHRYYEVGPIDEAERGRGDDGVSLMISWS